LREIDAQLFSGTIRENLLFVKPSATDEELLDGQKKKVSCQKFTQIVQKTVYIMKCFMEENNAYLSREQFLRNPNLLVF
jgi:ATP-binding cassette subfamily B protein